MKSRIELEEIKKKILNNYSNISKTTKCFFDKEESLKMDFCVISVLLIDGCLNMESILSRYDDKNTSYKETIQNKIIPHLNINILYNSKYSIFDLIKILSVHYTRRNDDMNYLKRFYNDMFGVGFYSKYIVMDSSKIMFSNTFNSLKKHFSFDDKYIYRFILWYAYNQGFDIYVFSDDIFSSFIKYVFLTYHKYIISDIPQLLRTIKNNEIIDYCFSDIITNDERYDWLKMLDIQSKIGNSNLFNDLCKKKINYQCSNFENRTLLNDRFRSFVSKSSVGIEFNKSLLLSNLDLKKSTDKTLEQPYFINNVDSENSSITDVEIIAMKNDLLKAQSTIKSLTEKISSLEDVINCKTNLIKILNEKNDKQRLMLDEQKINLKSFEEFVKCLQSNDSNMDRKHNLTDEDIDLLSRLKIVIVGGNEILQSNILSRFPNFKMIKTGYHTFDANLIKYSDIVCFISRYLDHATFYKAKEIAISVGKKYIYSGSNNIDIVLSDIAKGLKNSVMNI